MKKALGVLLLCSLFVPSVGSYLGYQYRYAAIKKEIKQRMIAGLNDSELHLITLNEAQFQSDLQWKHEGEFEYEGFMYDIVKREKVADTYFFWCWKDDKETALNKKLDQLLADLFGNNPKERQTHINLLQFYGSVFYVDVEMWRPTSLSVKVKKLPFSYINLYRSMVLGPDDPPPIV